MKLPEKYPYCHAFLRAVVQSGQLAFVQVNTADHHPLAILPYHLTHRYGFSLITPPPLSPRLGPWLFYPDNPLKPAQKRDFEHRVLTELVQKLPAVHYARIQWPYHLTNGLPWQMLGWRQTVRYSYVISLQQPLSDIWDRFKSQVRNKIRKAESMLLVESTNDWRLPLALTQQDFAYRGAKSQLSEALMARVFAALSESENCSIWVARDADGRPHAALFLVQDEVAAINLLLGSHPALRSSGATSLLLWHAIQHAHALGLAEFDFEGSHIPGVEAFFRAFGGEPRPYYQFTKASKLVRLAMAWQGRW